MVFYIGLLYGKYAIQYLENTGLFYVLRIHVYGFCLNYNNSNKNYLIIMILIIIIIIKTIYNYKNLPRILCY